MQNPKIIIVVPHKCLTTKEKFLSNLKRHACDINSEKFEDIIASRIPGSVILTNMKERVPEKEDVNRIYSPHMVKALKRLKPDYVVEVHSYGKNPWDIGYTPSMILMTWPETYGKYRPKKFNIRFQEQVRKWFGMKDAKVNRNVIGTIHADPTKNYIGYNMKNPSQRTNHILLEFYKDINYLTVESVADNLNEIIKHDHLQ